MRGWAVLLYSLLGLIFLGVIIGLVAVTALIMLALFAAILA